MGRGWNKWRVAPSALLKKSDNDPPHQGPSRDGEPEEVFVPSTPVAGNAILETTTVQAPAEPEWKVVASRTEGYDDSWDIELIRASQVNEEEENKDVPDAYKAGKYDPYRSYKTYPRRWPLPIVECRMIYKIAGARAKAAQTQYRVQVSEMAFANKQSKVAKEELKNGLTVTDHREVIGTIRVWVDNREVEIKFRIKLMETWPYAFKTLMSRFGHAHRINVVKADLNVAEGLFSTHSTMEWSLRKRIEQAPVVTPVQKPVYDDPLGPKNPRLVRIKRPEETQIPTPVDSAAQMIDNVAPMTSKSAVADSIGPKGPENTRTMKILDLTALADTSAGKKETNSTRLVEASPSKSPQNIGTAMVPPQISKPEQNKPQKTTRVVQAKNSAKILEVGKEVKPTTANNVSRKNGGGNPRGKSSKKAAEEKAQQLAEERAKKAAEEKAKAAEEKVKVGTASSANKKSKRAGKWNRRR